MRAPMQTLLELPTKIGWTEIVDYLLRLMCLSEPHSSEYYSDFFGMVLKPPCLLHLC